MNVSIYDWTTIRKLRQQMLLCAVIRVGGWRVEIGVSRKAYFSLEINDKNYK